ncbi:very short patch repair endonuclease [Longimicrobium sp.]|uniref:very short patch repair endonuclease n=1 Tax=Longimicrobium sp. TaxID=2029185 RepID=UPI002D7E5D9A|nr:very short patch repair endonuclease [Longimicrobium sp.]
MSHRPKAPEEIRRNMAAIRSSGNKTEQALAKTLHRMGLRYRKYAPGLPGRPDIVFPRSKVVVFVDGDYWHGRLLREQGMEAVEQRMKGVNIGYWKEKFARNMKRDDEVTAKLRTMGWTVIRLWESDVKRNVNGAADIVAKAVRINNVDIS